MPENPGHFSQEELESLLACESCTLEEWDELNRSGRVSLEDPKRASTHDLVKAAVDQWERERFRRRRARRLGAGIACLACVFTLALGLFWKPPHSKEAASRLVKENPNVSSLAHPPQSREFLLAQSRVSGMAETRELRSSQRVGRLSSRVAALASRLDRR